MPRSLTTSVLTTLYHTDDKILLTAFPRSIFLTCPRCNGLLVLGLGDSTRIVPWCVDDLHRSSCWVVISSITCVRSRWGLMRILRYHCIACRPSFAMRLSISGLCSRCAVICSIKVVATSCGEQRCSLAMRKQGIATSHRAARCAICGMSRSGLYPILVAMGAITLCIFSLSMVVVIYSTKNKCLCLGNIHQLLNYNCILQRDEYRTGSVCQCSSAGRALPW